METKKYQEIYVVENLDGAVESVWHTAELAAKRALDLNTKSNNPDYMELPDSYSVQPYPIFDKQDLKDIASLAESFQESLDRHGID